MPTTLAKRGISLFVTTMLVAVPAFAQTGGNQSGSQDNAAPPVAAAPSAAVGPKAPHASADRMPSAPSGTIQKAAPRTSQTASAWRPGDTMQSLVERRVAELHSRLHITAQQTQQWDQFAQVMRDNARDMDTIYQQRAEKFGTMTAIDNMQSYSQIEQQRAQGVQKLVPAFQTLYASLSDQQKKTADETFRNFAEKAHARHQASAAAR